MKLRGKRKGRNENRNCEVLVKAADIGRRTCVINDRIGNTRIISFGIKITQLHASNLSSSTEGNFVHIIDS